MLQPFYRLLIELTNGKWTSVILKKFSRSSVSRFMVPIFARAYHINQTEMLQPLHEFPTLHDLFIRKLKSDARNIDSDANSVVSPVDAVIEDVGPITETSDILVKGKIYSIDEMLGDREVLQKYLNGTYMILYLSPSHYHRIHSPVDGTVINQWTLGKKSYPVNKWGLKYGIRTLAKNYRVITEVKTSFGHVTIVKVGAMFVNSIETTHEGSELEKGKEMAYFSFGSTVVLLFEKDSFELDSQINTPTEIKVGERLGILRKS
ncbi:phosphatidylserine decarboxylase [Bacillus sp. JJ1764]|uniref:phosphatidylserine decarboxylase n=1 Tax=Bacillus sp. JJ1764 TaxID=3122964 RepID=UPI002FFFF31D